MVWARAGHLGGDSVAPPPESPVQHPPAARAGVGDFAGVTLHRLGSCLPFLLSESGCFDGRRLRSRSPGASSCAFPWPRVGSSRAAVYPRGSTSKRRLATLAGGDLSRPPPLPRGFSWLAPRQGRLTRTFRKFLGALKISVSGPAFLCPEIPLRAGALQILRYPTNFLFGALSSFPPFKILLRVESLFTRRRPRRV